MGGLSDMKSQLSHRDCLHFAPIDVVQGICHLAKTHRAADDAVCERFAILPKCRHCSSFNADDNSPDLGVCSAGDPQHPFMAYADMVAKTCEDYRPRGVKE